MTTLTPPTDLRLVRADGWWAVETLAPAAAVAEVRALFGTTVLPTPWRATVTAAVVAASVAARNPGAIVRIAREEA